MRRLVVPLAAVLIGVASFVVPLTPTTAAAATSATWSARLGALGLVSLRVGSVDRLVIAAKKLYPGQAYTITLRQGGCGAHGKQILVARYPASRTGSISRSISLTAAQAKSATLPLSLQLGSKCAPFVAPLQIPSVAGASVAARISTNGGTLGLEGGANLAFVPGAVGASTRVSISELIPTGVGGAGWSRAPLTGSSLYRIDASAPLAKPVTLALPYTGNARHPTIAYFDTLAGSWLPVPSVVDPATRTISAPVTHFSTWGVFDLDALLVAIDAALSGNLHSIFESASKLSTPCGTGSGPWHVDNVLARPVIEGCVTAQSDQDLTVVVRNIRLYPVKVTSAQGYIAETMVWPGDSAPPLKISRLDSQPATATAFMTSDTIYWAAAIASLEEVSAVASLGMARGVDVVSIGKYAVPLAAVKALAKAIKAAVRDFTPMADALRSGDAARVSYEFTRILSDDDVVRAISSTLMSLALTSGWPAVANLGVTQIAGLLAVLAPLVVIHVIADMMAILIDYTIGPATFEVSVTWDRLPTLPTPKIVNVQGPSQQTLSCGTRAWVVSYAIANASDYPPDLFMSRPAQPGPDGCGMGAAATRTWVDVLDGATRTLLRRECALTSPSDLNSLWFWWPVGTTGPTSFFVTMTDKATGAVARSSTITLAAP